MKCDCIHNDTCRYRVGLYVSFRDIIVTAGQGKEWKEVEELVTRVCKYQESTKRGADET